MKNTEYIKYPEMPYLESSTGILDSEVYAFEKLDGGNCQIRNIGGRVLPGSRSAFLEGDRVDNIWWFKDFVKWANSKESLRNLDPNFVMFGEWLAFHNIHYAPENENQFYLFDVYDIEEGKFVPYENALEDLEMMGIDVNTVRIVAKGRFDYRQLDTLLLEGKSDYRDGIWEGLVIKDYERQEFAKFLHPDFTEIAREKRSTAERYVTIRRIQKAISALNEEDVPATTDNLVLRMIKDIKKSHRVSLSEREVKNRLVSMMPQH